MLYIRFGDTAYDKQLEARQNKQSTDKVRDQQAR